MVAREWRSVTPFPFRVEGGEELRSAVSEVALQYAAALGEEAEEARTPPVTRDEWWARRPVRLVLTAGAAFGCTTGARSSGDCGWHA